MKLEDMALLFYFFATDIQIFKVRLFLPSLDKRTVMKFYQKLRGIVAAKGAKIKLAEAIDGMTDIVEIDESKFGKVCIG